MYESTKIVVPVFFFFYSNIKNVKVTDLEKQDVSKKALNGELKNITDVKKKTTWKL